MKVKSFVLKSVLTIALAITMFAYPKFVSNAQGVSNIEQAEQVLTDSIIYMPCSWEEYTGYAGIMMPVETPDNVVYYYRYWITKNPDSNIPDTSILYGENLFTKDVAPNLGGELCMLDPENSVVTTYWPPTDEYKTGKVVTLASNIVISEYWNYSGWDPQDYYSIRIEMCACDANNPIIQTPVHVYKSGLRYVWDEKIQ